MSQPRVHFVNNGSAPRTTRDTYITVKSLPGLVQEPPFFIRYANALVVPKTERFEYTLRYFRGEEFKVGPIFMFLVTLVQVSLHLYCGVYQMLDTIPSDRCYAKNLFAFNSARRYEIWRYVTYALIHKDNSHLLFNVLVQTFIGFPLEMVHGFRRTSLIYIGGALGGSLGQSIFNSGTYCLIGASAGVYSLLAATLANMIVNWGELDYRWLRFFVYISFLMTDFIRTISYANQLEVSVLSHVFGALSGLLIGLYCIKNLRIQRWELAVGRASIIAYLIMMIFAIMFNTFIKDFYPFPDYNDLGSFTICESTHYTEDSN